MLILPELIKQLFPLRPTDSVGSNVPAFPAYDGFPSYRIHAQSADPPCSDWKDLPRPHPCNHSKCSRSLIMSTVCYFLAKDRNYHKVSYNFL